MPAHSLTHTHTLVLMGAFTEREEDVGFCGLCEVVMRMEPPVMVVSSGTTISTLELSDVDQLLNHYFDVALFFSAPPPPPPSTAGSNSCTTSTSASTTTTTTSANTRDIFCIARVLRSALKELLLHYPAAAGRLSWNAEDSTLEVLYGGGGGGVQFISAHAAIPFCELGDIANPHPSLDLLYPTLQQEPESSPAIVAIQVTSFVCGSFTLAMKCSHAYMDGYGAAVFLQNLCSIARGHGLTIVPDEAVRRGEMWKPRISTHTPVLNHEGDRSSMEKRTLPKLSHALGKATRLVFHTCTLEGMRQSIQATMLQGSCSRYLALVAFIWSSLAKTLLVAGKHEGSHEFSLGFAMNLRGRISHFTERYVGNAIMLAVVRAAAKEVIESPLHVLVEKMQSAAGGVLSNFGKVKVENFKPPAVTMPSFVGLPFYDIDCGWGGPMYCSRPSTQSANRVIILNDPTSHSWNLLISFGSKEEKDLFQEAMDLKLRTYNISKALHSKGKLHF